MKPSLTTYIYVLKDPKTGLVRYVGKSNNPKKRFQAHLLRAATENNHRANWVRSLAEGGGLPKLEIIDEVPTEFWPQWEVAWIEYFCELGCDLTNATPGGDSGPDVRGEKNPMFGRCGDRSPCFGRTGEKHPMFGRTGEKHPMFGRKLSLEHREKISVVRKGKKQAAEKSAAHSIAMSGKSNPMFGKCHSLETLARMSAAQKARHAKKRDLLWQ